MKKHLLLLIAILLPLLANAQTKVEIDGIWYNLNSEAMKAEVTDGKWYSGSITIPTTVSYEDTEYSVTSIGKSAFDSCDLTSIILSTSITNIGDEAFRYCCSLTTIIIPENSQLTSIGNFAFSECSSLTAINIPENVISIGREAFYGCSSLTDINIPEGVTSIEWGAFYGCSRLTSITIPASVKDIGYSAFSDCDSLTSITVANGNTIYDSRKSCNAIINTATGSLIVGCSTTFIPEDVMSIEHYAFHGSSLTSIIIPESVKSVGLRAFEGCSNLATVSIPEQSKLESLGENAFASCSSLTDFAIPEGLKNIGPMAFFECSNLKSITIPKSVKSIGSMAFYECSSLKSITFLGCVTSIEYWAFDCCHSLTAITCKTSMPSTIDENTFSSYSKSIPVYVPMGSVEAYKSAEYWREFTNIIGVEEFKCATPTISYADGKLLFACDTEGAEIKTRVLTENDSEYTGTELAFIPTHTFTAYATIGGFEDSDVATLTLCWIPCSEEHESEETALLAIPSKPVLISTQGGTITLSGLAADTEVAAYTTAGTQLATATATGGTVTLDTGLEAGSIAIVKIGEHIVKIAVK